MEQFGIYSGDFVEGEAVVVEEKLHGSQLVAYVGSDEDCTVHRWVSTKNYNKEGLYLLDSPTQFYWMCTRDVGL